MNLIDENIRFINTEEFSPEAKAFLKAKYFTTSPRGTFAYREYWEEQTKRCAEGYEVGGVRITGPHYFYLNFCQIKATITTGKTERKILTFPRFLDMDYHYFHELERARLEGKGMIVAKARRKGFSYKNAAICVHQYTFYRDSTTIIGAFMHEYSQATMYMGLEMLNFINKFTAWTKRRNPDRRDHVKSRFQEVIDGNTVWSGYNSEIYTLTFKDNFSAAIGKTADLFLFEEAGKWPNLIDSYMVTAPVFRDGDIMTGIPIIFGTGGDMEGGSNDEGAVGNTCGMFIDDMWYKPGRIVRESGKIEDMVDTDGNSNRPAVVEYLDKERAVIKQSGSRRTWEKYITQSPKTPREAFLRVSSNIFPVIELNKWLGKLETSKKVMDLAMIGELYWEEDKVRWQPNVELRPVKDFPVKSDDDKEGCVVIWEHPYMDDNGEIPYGLYIAGTDPYDQDTSGTSSLGSTFIYKTFQKFDRTYNLVVAEYTGRPDTAKAYYEIVRKLLSYYNAKSLYENNLKGLKIYFEQKKCLHLLKEQPSILKDIVKSSAVQRGYGIHMSEPIKRQAEIYLRDWLLEKRGDGENDEGIFNLHRIYSVPLIKELISYNKDGNFDRAIALMLCILHSHENHKINLDEQFDSELTDPFWRKPLFKKKGKSRFARL